MKNYEKLTQTMDTVAKTYQDNYRESSGSGFNNHFTPAVSALFGDIIAISHGIFMPHFPFLTRW